MVHPIDPASMDELADQEHRGVTREHDVLVGAIKWPLWKVLLVTVGTAGAFGGVEAALILTIRPIYRAGNETPVIVIGVVAAILLASGLLPPIVLELGIFASHVLWLFRTRKIRKHAKSEDKTFDDVMLEYEQRDLPFKFAERKGGLWPWKRGQDKSDEELGPAGNEKGVNENPGGDEVGGKHRVNDEHMSRSGEDVEERGSGMI
ncbi:hypothetical protein NPX13_g8327 [Xylaria arbuscula]|uniref:Uncharacterized protein n=1 Tax=Xylaria arbuscula TaxID=114810 RepID=A0A9W8TK98_9PEZI|nr:hypothetical protein NPX13_g8327 [Xylaria arbuscula]